MILRGDFVVKDTLNNIEQLAKYGENFRTAINFLKETDLKTLTPGKYEIDQDSVYAFFCEVKLVDPKQAKLETHQKYADIQVVIEGCEGMQFAPVNTLSINKKYSEESDIAFYEDADSSEMLMVSAGEFALFMPEDAHKPNCFVGQGKYSKKLIIKVSL